MIAKLSRLVRRGLAAGCALAALAVAAPAAAEPAVWVLKDADSTIYLFGTVHVLRPDTDWRSEKITRALGESSELVLEIVGMDDPKTVAPLLQTYGLDRQRPLSSKLDADDREKLAAAAKVLGMPPQALEPMKPWLAAMTLTLAPIVKAGFDPQSGVELILTKEAKAAGKPLGALETAEQQVRFFADMPEATQTAFLSATLDDVEEGAGQLDHMVSAWQAGDVKALEAAFIEETRRDYPALYEVAVVKRNRDWADQLKAKLAGSGVSFVAVGAGHLVGPDSVQAELARRGVTVERR
ncbi:TraB/GumN family protein [Phenylobacterium sp. VNQ135]|uniref:TraB/GumN family protein n=1 Tax=Phenylobacterium sp. VNQ135 TaxID=3400922 RepID=UPI003BFDE7D1